MLLTTLTSLCLLSTTTGLILDDASSLQVQLEQERQARIQLQADVISLQSKMRIFEESINNECTLKCPASKQLSVSFMAQLSKDLVNPATGHVVVFDDVITNDGNGYNNLHGIFTAPVNGTYNFNLIASSRPGSASHMIHLFLKKNGAQTGYIFLDWNDKLWLRRSTDITVRMIQGDEMWVEVGYVKDAHTLAGCCFHTHFSGFLINAE